MKIVLKGGLEVLPQKFFTELGTKLGNSRHFWTRRMTYTSAATTRGVDCIYEICII